MFKSKVAQIPIIKMTLIILVTSILFIFFLFQFFSASTIILNEKDLTQQIISNKIIQKSCTSEKFGIINLNSYEKNLEDCLSEFDDSNIIKIEIEKIAKDFTSTQNIVLTNYINTQENEFLKEKQFCSILSTKKCFKEIYPILIKTDSEALYPANLELQIIS